MYYSWCITFQSITYAQKAQRFLRSKGIDTMLQRTPAGLSQRGCSYCLQLREQHISQAVEALRQEQMLTGRIFARNPWGTWEERML